MLGKVFSVLVLLSFVFAGITGNMENMSDAAINGAADAVRLSISLLGIMCLWTGIVRVLDKAGFTRFVSAIIFPLLKFIFPEASKNKNTISYIATSFSANLLGLGNAALPLGIKVMTSLSETSHSKSDKASDDMVMFSVLNTTPIQLFPTTLFALRAAHLSSNPGEILFPVWICSIATTIFAVIICKCFAKVFR